MGGYEGLCTKYRCGCIKYSVNKELCGMTFPPTYEWTIRCISTCDAQLTELSSEYIFSPYTPTPPENALVY